MRQPLLRAALVVCLPLIAGAPAYAAPDTKEFVQKVAISDMFEIEAGKLAADKAEHAEVKSFGDKMVADHTKTSEELKSIIAENKIDAESQPNSTPSIRRSSMLSTLASRTREARVEESKMDGLLSASVLIRDVLEAPRSASATRPLVVLDDFYHVPFADQPDVLAYLHQVVKNLDIFLKICGVRHRLQPFVEGDPPRGMQIGQDAAEISSTSRWSDSRPRRPSSRRCSRHLRAPRHRHRRNC